MSGQHSRSSITHVCFGMYPFEPLRPAWEALWTAVHDRAPFTPAALSWDDGRGAPCRDPTDAVSHVCGWPLATVLRDSVSVVGAFSLGLPDADGHRYRSVLAASRPGRAEPTATTTAAVNSDDSLTGWISLGVATAGPGGRWPGRVHWTGSHLDSVRAVRDGIADVASVDPLSWAYIRRLLPDLVDGLHEVGHGPWVPSPPVVVPASTGTDAVDTLRDAFVEAMAAPDTLAARSELHLEGFVALDHSDYAPLLALSPTR